MLEHSSNMNYVVRLTNSKILLADETAPIISLQPSGSSNNNNINSSSSNHSNNNNNTSSSFPYEKERLLPMVTELLVRTLHEDEADLDEVEDGFLFSLHDSGFESPTRQLVEAEEESKPRLLNRSYSSIHATTGSDRFKHKDSKFDKCSLSSYSSYSSTSTATRNPNVCVLRIAGDSCDVTMRRRKSLAMAKNNLCLKEKKGLEWQDVSMWLGTETEASAEAEVVWRCTGTGIKRKTWMRRVRRRLEQQEQDGCEGEDLYESIYEVVNPPHEFASVGGVGEDEDDDDFYSESDFDEILLEEDEEGTDAVPSPEEVEKRKSIKRMRAPVPPSSQKPLVKLAEAANKKMKKLRRHWSLKKSDISRSLSKIRTRQYSRPGLLGKNGELVFIDSNSKNVDSVSAVALVGSARRAPSFKTSGVVKCNRVENTTFYITLNIEEKEEERTDKGPSVPPRRKVSSKYSSAAATQYAVIRPTVAPPAPPVLPLLPNSSSPFGDSFREFYVGFEETSTSSSSSNSSGLGVDLLDLDLGLEETYTSSLFQTEPLYQFYDRDLGVYSSDSDTVTTGGSVLSQPFTSSSSPIGKVDEEERRTSTALAAAAENMYESLDNLDQLCQNDNMSNNKCNNNNATPVVAVAEEEVVVRRRRQPAHKTRSSAMDLVHAGGRRSMWGELPEVIDSGILGTINLDGKRLQEALFEVVSSEASYLKSLNVLISHFAQSPKLLGPQSVISARDHRTLFSDVVAVRQTSERFLADLEKLWQDSVMLEGVCAVVKRHAADNFGVYVKYCSNQVYQDRMLKKLGAENPKFVDTLRELESSSVCQSLGMHSFLMLPMQRITRLPLLLSAIYHRIDRSRLEEYHSCKEALDMLNRLVKECNESARSMERMEEMLILSQQLDFKDVRRAVPLISASRWLVKRGEAVRVGRGKKEEAKLTFGRKVNRQTLCFFLFTDLLVITKRKNDDHYHVVDHCPRNLVTLTEVDSECPSVAFGTSSSGAAVNVNKYMSESPNLAWLTLLQNHENRTVEWLVSFSSECDRLRWMEAVTPPVNSDANGEGKGDVEKVYESWDCPEVEGVGDYDAQEEDEVALRKGEKANVLRKLSESGWCYVERQSDGRRGWVPMSATREIDSGHVRARNFKQRHAFLKSLSSSSAVNGDSKASSLLLS